ncbi:hypothetical protein CMEL01_16667 [Colletotrichum melonis]|uniref:Uncharacterized protein n=1 Tax=Colletotrichum melonis TaxID=1209925 RepID=A0AAI9UA23_9PEZI|nr:hypothetical protein CMEL01_16667 [Colletotrichum melonis]
MALPQTTTQLSRLDGALRQSIVSETHSNSNNTIRNASQHLPDHDRSLSTTIDAAAEKACPHENLRSPHMEDLENHHDLTPRYNSFCGKGDDTVTVLSKDILSGPNLPIRLSGCACGDHRKPKAITRTSFWKHSKVEVAVHTAALALTAFALWLGWKERYWFALEGPSPDRGINADVIINSLQLPAKPHEILIVASLSFIMLAMCRRRLVGEGVKLGFLIEAYQVGDLEYILAPSSPLWHMGFKYLSLTEVVLTCYLVSYTHVYCRWSDVRLYAYSDPGEISIGPRERI